jgi:hypothetical protein
MPKRFKVLCIGARWRGGPSRDLENSGGSPWVRILVLAYSRRLIGLYLLAHSRKTGHEARLSRRNALQFPDFRAQSFHNHRFILTRFFSSGKFF